MFRTDKWTMCNFSWILFRFHHATTQKETFVIFFRSIKPYKLYPYISMRTGRHNKHNWIISRGTQVLSKKWNIADYNFAKRYKKSITFELVDWVCFVSLCHISDKSVNFLPNRENGWLKSIVCLEICPELYLSHAVNIKFIWL